MYPKISDLINDWFGTNINLPIQSYGFFVAMAFLCGAYFLYHELKRREHKGLIIPKQKKVMVGEPASLTELALSFVISLLVGFKIGGFILEYSAFASNPQAFVFSGRGSWWLGLLLAAGYTYYIYYSKDKKKLSPPKEEVRTIHAQEHTWPIVFVAVVFGILGAKVFHWFENWDDFVADPMEALVSFSGLTFYGGLITATFAVAFYGEKNNIRWRQLADAIAPSLILSYGIGRIGCQVSGDGDWGIVNMLDKPSWISFLPDWLWAYDYPHNILKRGIPIPDCTGEYCYKLAEPVFPTPIYETTMALLIFVFLWCIRKRIKTAGVLFAIYLIANGSERFLIEKIRVNNVFDFLGLQVTQAEIISSILILTGIGLWIILKKYDQIKGRNES